MREKMDTLWLRSPLEVTKWWGSNRATLLPTDRHARLLAKETAMKEAKARKEAAAGGGGKRGKGRKGGRGGDGEGVKGMARKEQGRQRWEPSARARQRQGTGLLPRRRKVGRSGSSRRKRRE